MRSKATRNRADPVRWLRPIFSATALMILRSVVAAGAKRVAFPIAVFIMFVAALYTPARAADAVTEWTIEADRLGQGGANWRTLAIMHMAMHDAAQSIQPRFVRWYLPPPVPASRGASQEAAIAASAAQVLLSLHPGARDEIIRLFRAAIARLPTPGVAEGIAVGEAIGRAAVLYRADDGYERIHAFGGSELPGRWRPTPPDQATSNTTAAMPFLFLSRDWPGERPPPVPGDPASMRDTVELRFLGGTIAPSRARVQTEAAEFWAYQSSQRGFVLLAVKELDADASGDLAEHARLMSLLAAGLADAAVLTWAEKERYSSWRPVTVLNAGMPGIPPDANWRPLIETPAHPEYPSGHAADCYTGAAILANLFKVTGPIEYVAQSALPQGAVAAIGMGQHVQSGGLHPMTRRFASVQDAAQECADSRIWAGAHFRSANEESRRLGNAIAASAGTRLPPAPLLPR